MRRPCRSWWVIAIDPHYLHDLLNSFQAQTDLNFEVIVVDDASAPAIRQKLHKLLQRNWKFPITLLEQKQKGARETRNLGAVAAQNPLLVFIDDDNALLPQSVETYRRCFENSNFQIFVSPFIRVHSREDLRQTKKLSQENRIWCPMGGGGDLGVLENVLGDMNLMIAKKDYERLGGLSTLTQLSCEDWQFLLLAQAQGFSIGVIPQMTQVYFDQPNSFFKRAPRILSELSAVAPVLQDLISTDEHSHFGTSSMPTLSSVEIAKSQMRNFYDQFRKIPAPGPILYQGALGDTAGFTLKFPIEDRESRGTFSLRFDAGSTGHVPIHLVMGNSEKIDYIYEILKGGNQYDLQIPFGVREVRFEFPRSLIYVHWACLHGLRKLRPLSNF